MDFSVLRRHGSTLLGLTVALTVGSNALKANVLTATPSATTVTCNTQTGFASPATIVVKDATALTGSTTLAVTFGAITGGFTLSPSSATSIRVTPAPAAPA